MKSRYDGKPFLKLLDQYFLDAIGMLDEDDEAWLKASEPNFRLMFGATGSWREIVESRMQFPAGMPGAIREVWEKGRPKYLAAYGHEPNPIDFIQRFIDNKFPH